ncbi:hypothetical protein L873DRAFT_634594 [Choiromyces venosus 120613-1]|uniref:Uncharacterized protein n=1 Tax=Choiromyces venosus 120613-1 TaxID=1336337 RepID=A0A3N4JTB1_9PEZI|nr:hypothetical protein L873DRAFT_634594 [Choiromyces venosus 120613-1]
MLSRKAKLPLAPEAKVCSRRTNERSRTPRANHHARACRAAYTVSNTHAEQHPRFPTKVDRVRYGIDGHAAHRPLIRFFLFKYGHAYHSPVYTTWEGVSFHFCECMIYQISFFTLDWNIPEGISCEGFYFLYI